MSSKLYKVSVGRVAVACFALDEVEAVERACEAINEQYPDAMLDPDTCFFDIKTISADTLQFDEEVFG